MVAYTAPDPDGSQDEGISGADVVAENLRRACLWDLVGGDDIADKSQVGVGKVWWDYASEFTVYARRLRHLQTTRVGPRRWPTRAPTSRPSTLASKGLVRPRVRTE